MVECGVPEPYILSINATKNVGTDVVGVNEVGLVLEVHMLSTAVMRLHIECRSSAYDYHPLAAF